MLVMKNQKIYARPDVVLYAEAVLALIAASIAYGAWFPHRWVVFGCGFFVPDLSLLPYIWAEKSTASAAYNLFHSYVLPAVLGLGALYFGSVLCAELSLIWISHISFDRMAGYGLKYESSFQFTHMQNAAFPADSAKQS